MRKADLPLWLGILLACVSLSGCASWGRTTSSDMDINSGDYRYQEFRGDRLVKSEIHESALSQEARRLGIDLPAERRWKPMHRNRPGGRHEDSAYGFVMGVGNDLVRILAATNRPDDERRVVLAEFLTMLHRDGPLQVWDRGYFLILDIGDKQGVHIYTAEFEEEIRKMRSKRQSQVTVR